MALNHVQIDHPTLKKASVTSMADDQAHYLIKLYAFNHKALFGAYQGNSIILTPTGQIVADEWVRSALHHQNIELDNWLVMPDHVSGIVVLKSYGGGIGSRSLQPTLESTKPRLLSFFVAGFKAAAAKRINLLHNQPGRPVWQRSYDEQLISDVVTLDRLRQQIYDQGHLYQGNNNS